MKIKVSDYIADYLVARGIRYNFTVPGGGAMHLNMSFGHKNGMQNIFMQHEQAAAMAAEAFYRIHNELPFVCCTTGPGGTNTLTGVLGAWLDSIPMLVISGQVKYLSTVRSTGMPLRIFGDQEFDITKAASAMTKYAQMITKPELVKYHLDKALYLAMHGRPGPVWLDVPQDVQSAMIDPADFLEFHEAECGNMNPLPVSDRTLDLLLEKLSQAERPAIFAGTEIRNHGAYDAFLELARKLNVPVVTSFDGIDIMPDDDPLCGGRAGDVGNRIGNWTVQNSDFLLVIGSRLGIRQVNYAVDTWARAAFVAAVHEDPAELLKPWVHVELPIRADIKEFITQLSAKLYEPLPKNQKWFERIAAWKRNYPPVDPVRHYADTPLVNPYCVINELGLRLSEGTPIVSGNGTASVVGGNALQMKKGQRFVVNSGVASMGYDLPAAIGVCFASGKRETICLSGDGSIQMNLQELQTIVFHKLPIKILIFNNAGYHSMRQTQNNLFPGESKVGVGPESGDLSFPDMSKIAAAYGIPYMSASNKSELGAVLDRFLAADGYAICEVFVDTTQEFEPKPKARKLADGTIISPPLEDMAPFLSRDELRKVMVIPLMDEGKTDIFVHCAGLNRLAGIDCVDETLLDEVFQVNLYSAIALLRAMTPYMVAKKWGRIVFISSLYSIISREKRIAYSASKNALTGLAKTMTLELAPYNVLTNCVAPGYVLTDMTQKNLTKQEISEIECRIPTGRFQSEEEIANLTLYLCSDMNQSITGQLIAVDGGYICQ